MISSNATRVGYKDYENYTSEMQLEIEQVRLKREQLQKDEMRKKERESNLVIQTAIAIALAVVLLISAVATRASTIEAYNELYTAQNTYQQMQNEFDRLSLELSKAKALDKIDLVARENLGMVTPTKVSTIVVSMVERTDVGNVKMDDAASNSRSGILPTILAFFYPVVERLASSVTAGWMTGTQVSLPSVLD